MSQCLKPGRMPFFLPNIQMVNCASLVETAPILRRSSSSSQRHLAMMCWATWKRIAGRFLAQTWTAAWHTTWMMRIQTWGRLWFGGLLHREIGTPETSSLRCGAWTPLSQSDLQMSIVFIVEASKFLNSFRHSCQKTYSYLFRGRRWKKLTWRIVLKTGQHSVPCISVSPAAPYKYIRWGISVRINQAHPYCQCRFHFFQVIFNGSRRLDGQARTEKSMMKGAAVHVLVRIEGSMLTSLTVNHVGCILRFNTADTARNWVLSWFLILGGKSRWLSRGKYLCTSLHPHAGKR
jgi:hypothetical protein